MNRTRSLFATAVLALTAPVAIAACGGDSGASDEDPQEIINAIFSNDEQVTSGELDLSLDLSAGDQGNFSASLSGPFQGVEDEPTALPRLDLTATASGEGSGQTIDFEGGLVVTEDNAFVEYQGETYEVGTQTFSSFKDSFEAQAAQAQPQEDEDASASFQEECEQAVEAQGGDPTACDFEISGWFTNLTNEGTEDRDGTETVHVSGDVDVAQFLDDLIGIAQTFPGASGQVNEDQVDQATQAITEASFDIYSGTDDDLLRQLDINLTVDPSQVEGGELVPVDTVDLGVSLGVSAVNEEQTIEAPSGAQPIDELLGQFGISGLGPLGGLGGGGLGGGGEDLGGVSPEQQEQLDCVAEAGDDAEALNECLGR